MSDDRDPTRDQQAPTLHEEGEGFPSTHDLACDMLQERKAFGTRKYGTPLQPANGRSFLLDATEEAADMLAYLRGRLWEEDNPERTWLGALCWELLTGNPDRVEEMIDVPTQVRIMVAEMQTAIDSDDLEGPQ